MSHDLYYAALAADDAYHAEVVRVYGAAQAGDKRYVRHTDPALLAAQAVKRAADDAWREAQRALPSLLQKQAE